MTPDCLSRAALPANRETAGSSLALAFRFPAAAASQDRRHIRDAGGPFHLRARPRLARSETLRSGRAFATLRRSCRRSSPRGGVARAVRPGRIRPDRALGKDTAIDRSRPTEHFRDGVRCHRRLHHLPTRRGMNGIATRGDGRELARV